jgi:transcriptional regulator with XRE-family HTH domain
MIIGGMLYVMNTLASRKYGPEATMPPFIKQRMKELGQFPGVSHLARQLEMNTGTLGKYMRGERSVPISVLINLAATLKISLDDLVKNVPEFID